ncbi:MAG: DUF503 domain-containing protein [Nocardioidaceae bacterium]|nr:DUF503 family protein [Propionibacteriales bacterium]
MYVGLAAYDLLLGDVRTLKTKRGAVRPLVAELRRRFEVSVAETGHRDLYRRSEIGVAVVSGDPRHCTEVLDRIDRWWDERPEVELVAVRRRLRSIDDE